jgi:hypothetical protein
VRQESECTTQTDCYGFAVLMWEFATGDYAWRGLNHVQVSSAALYLVAGVSFCRPWTIPVQVFKKVAYEKLRPETLPVEEARPAFCPSAHANFS